MNASTGEFIAIDADGHIQEADELFQQYLPEAFRQRMPGGGPNPAGARRYYFDGEPHPPFPDAISIRKPMSAEDRLKVLNKERILTAVLFPSAGLVGLYAADATMGQALSRAYDDWILDYIRPTNGRLLFVAPLPLHDVDWAIAEAQRAVGLGAVGVAIRPNPTLKRNLDDPAYDRLYAAIQELDVPLTIHESTGCPETVGGDRYGILNPDSYAFNHVISHSFEQMFAAMSVICGGVLERFPRLRVAFLEAGCSWAPYWLARLDDHFEHRIMGRQMAPLTMKPSEYFQRQCMVSCDPHDHTIPLGIAGLGADKIMFATDYPHFDSGGNSVRGFLDVPDISPEDQRKLLWENAVDFYRLKLPVAA